MTIAALAITGFALMAAYDVANTMNPKGLLSRVGFAAGVLLAVLSVVFALAHGLRIVHFRWAGGVLALVAAALLVYTLVFALPFAGTYVEHARGRKVCRRGMYALCRHPAALWMLLLAAGLSVALPCRDVYLAAWLAAGLNIIYVWFQDVWSFPREFSDYVEYRAETPFLLPTPGSIRLAISGLRGDGA